MKRYIFMNKVIETQYDIIISIHNSIVDCPTVHSTLQVQKVLYLLVCGCRDYTPHLGRKLVRVARLAINDAARISVAVAEAVVVGRTLCIVDAVVFSTTECCKSPPSIVIQIIKSIPRVAVVMSIIAWVASPVTSVTIPRCSTTEKNTIIKHRMKLSKAS